MNPHWRRIFQAIEAALESHSRFRVGASLYRGTKLLKTGHNDMQKTHPQQERWNLRPATIGRHAEFHACRGIPDEQLRGATLYVARVKKISPHLGLAKPCQTCQRFLRAKEIQRIIYTRYDDLLGTLELEKTYREVEPLLIVPPTAEEIAELRQEMELYVE